MVPYSLSEIHLPDSPTDVIKSSSKTVVKMDSSFPQTLREEDLEDNRSNSDSEVQTNGVNSVTKLIDKHSSSKPGSDKECSIKDKPIKDVKPDSHVSDTEDSNTKGYKSDANSDKEKKLKINIVNSKQKQNRTPSQNESASSETESKVKKVRKSNSHSEKESKSDNSSGDSSHSGDNRRRRTKKVVSPKRIRRRKHSSSSSSSGQSFSSRESSPENKSEDEVKSLKKTKILPVTSEIVKIADKSSPNSKTKSSVTIPDSVDPPRRKLKINRNNVVISASLTEPVKSSDKNISEECAKDSSEKSTKISLDGSSQKKKHNDPVSPIQESRESVEREMGEIIETIPEIKYETRKLNFPGRKMPHMSADQQPSDEPKSKKSKWGKFASSQKSSQTINISTDSLKNWFPDFKLVNEPVSVNELMAEDSPPIKEENKKLTFPHNTEVETVTKQATLGATHEKSIELPSIQSTETSGPVSKIVFIQNLVRPFTLLQLKDLLKQTGNLLDEEFWIDKIKSKCFATYETEDEAIKTKNALNGTRWPSSNPKILTAEFSTEKELELHRSGADVSKPVLENISQTQDTYEPKVVLSTGEHRKRERETEKRKDRDTYRTRAPVREWDKDKVSQESPGREGIVKEADGFRTEKKEKKDVKKKPNEDTPAKLLDDLFQKTKSAPCIYWLPLTDIQVAEREEAKRLRRVEREKKTQQREQEESERRNKRPRSDRKSREADNRRSSTRSRSPASRRR